MATPNVTFNGYATALPSTVDFSKLGVYNAKNYGAKGDGATDDSAAIESAISALDSAGGGTLYFPTAVYMLNNVKLPGSPIRILLETATLRCNAAQSMLYNYNGATPQGSTFAIDGKGVLDGNSVGLVGLDFQYHQAGDAKVSILGDITFSNWLQFGIRCLGTPPKYVYFCGALKFIQNSGSPGSNPNQAFNIQGVSGAVILGGSTFVTGAGNVTGAYGALTVISNTGKVNAQNIIGTNNHGAFVFGSNGPTELVGLQNDSFDAGTDGIDIINQVFCKIVNCGCNGAHGNGFAIGNTTAGQTTRDVDLIGCWSTTTGGAGFALGQNFGTEDNIRAIGCTAKNAGTSNPGTVADGAGFEVIANGVTVMGCRAYDDQGIKTQTYGIAELHTAGTRCIYSDNDLTGNKTGAVLLVASSASKAHDNTGYNPVGSVTITPASHAWTNTSGVTVQAYVATAGSYTGTTTITPSGGSAVTVPNAVVGMSYSVPPNAVLAWGVGGAVTTDPTFDGLGT